jgi:hypothetical protein
VGSEFVALRFKRNPLAYWPQYMWLREIQPDRHEVIVGLAKHRFRLAGGVMEYARFLRNTVYGVALRRGGGRTPDYAQDAFLNVASHV